jgi:hypothetical protein
MKRRWAWQVIRTVGFKKEEFIANDSDDTMDYWHWAAKTMPDRYTCKRIMILG